MRIKVYASLAYAILTFYVMSFGAKYCNRFDNTQPTTKKRSEFCCCWNVDVVAAVLTGSFVSFPFWCVSIDVHVLKSYSPHDSSKRNQHQQQNIFCCCFCEACNVEWADTTTTTTTNRHDTRTEIVQCTSMEKLVIDCAKKSIGLNKCRLMCACACIRNGQNAFSRSWKQNA